MASEIENMFHVGSNTPWHNQSTKLDAAPTVHEAIVAAGLDWNVEVQPTFLTNGQQCTANATVRTSDSRILGSVGPSYTPLQNTEAFDFFQPFLDSGLAELHTAGSLRNGERVWVLARIKGDPLVIVPQANDTVERFILLSNGHDGKLAVRAGFTPIRVLCANTMALAHNHADSKLLRVRHHSRVAHDVNEIRKIMNVANSDFEATAEQYRYLASTQINADDLEKYVKEVFQAKDDAPRLLKKVIPLFESGRGNNFKGVAGTYWCALNSVTEFLSWERGHNADNRLDSLWFGPGANTNARALSVALKMAQAA